MTPPFTNQHQRQGVALAVGSEHTCLCITYIHTDSPVGLGRFTGCSFVSVLAANQAFDCNADPSPLSTSPSLETDDCATLRAFLGLPLRPGFLTTVTTVCAGVVWQDASGSRARLPLFFIIGLLPRDPAQ